MSKIGQVQIGGRHIDLYAFTGVVVDQSTSHYTEAQIHSNNQITTRTNSYSQLFVRAVDGEERELNVPNMKIGVRTGNTVTLIWGIIAGRKKGDYIAVYNNDTKALHNIRKGNNDTAGPPGYNMMLLGAVIVTMIGLYGVFSGDMSSLFFMLIGGGIIYWIYTRQKKLMAAVSNIASSLRPTVQTGS